MRALLIAVHSGRKPGGKKKENVLSEHLQHPDFGSDFASPPEIQRVPLVRGLRAMFGGMNNLQ